MVTLQQLTSILREGNHSLAVASADGTVTTLDNRGVIDLYRLLTLSPLKLKDALVADKVVGKGAAALMIAGQIKALHTNVISRPALDLFSLYPTIEVTYDTLTDGIINRQGTGPCPIESLCRATDNPEECVTLIHGFLVEKGILKEQLKQE